MSRVSVDGVRIFIEQDAIEEVERIAKDIFNGVVRRTPVRTGRARASWVVGFGAPSNAVAPISGSPDSPQPPPQFPKFTMRKLQAVYIDNNVPYIQYLEFGSPTTEATGMVAASVSSYI